MDTTKLYNHWLKNSEEKWKTTQSLIRSRRYSDALFFCHLTLELELKASVALEIKDYPPLIHDLAKLTLLAGLSPTSKQLRELEIISSFNIKARYDDYKISLYKIATKNYTEKYFNITKNLRLWIKKSRQLKK